jgi:hypothetical protein
MRQFGLADPGEIADALSEPPLPSLVALERKIKFLGLRLPPNVSSRFLAKALLAAVNDDLPATLKWQERFGTTPNFGALKPGVAHAARYHRTIFQALEGIFDGYLSNGKIEQQINTGIHRVDIMFDNDSKRGFFKEVRKRIGLESYYVPVECKNYGDDIGSPEYDQLSGRLNKQVGQIGLLVFRKVKDQTRALEHVKAKWSKDELIIILDDTDILRMHKARYDGQPHEVDEVLWNKVRSLKLNSIK